MFTPVRKTIFYGLWFTSSRMLIGAYSVLYLMSRGIDLRDIALLKGLQAFIILVTDLPVGYFADQKSRKLSVIIGVMFGAIWMAMTAYAPNKYWLYTAEGFNALSLSFFNGAYQAILIDTYRKYHEDAKLENVLGKFSKYQFSLMAVAALVGGAFVKVESSIFWWIGAGFLALETLFFSSFILSNKDIGVQSSERVNIAKLISDSRKIMKKLKFHKYELALFFLVSIVVVTYYQIFIQYWQPLLSMSIGGSSKGYFYSVTFTLILLAQSLSGHYVPRFSDYKWIFKLILIALLGTAVFLHFGVQYLRFFVIAGLAMFFFLFRMIAILISSHINAQIEPELRATYISLQSTLVRLVLVGLLPIVGMIFKNYGLINLLLIAIVMSGILIFVPLDKKYYRFSEKVSNTTA